MRQQAVNTFNEGLNFDLNPLTTPNNVLTDAVNASFITFNGDELALQNDAGNTKIEYVKQEEKLTIVYGALYNWYAATDARKITSSDEWGLPTNTNIQTLITYLGGNNVAGGHLKEMGNTYWISQSSGTDNSTKFNGRGSGYRAYNTGEFFSLKELGYFHSATERSATESYYAFLAYDNEYIAYFDGMKNDAISIRLLYKGTGTPTSYVGNDGKIYPVVLIGTQYWVASDLAETKYRNGDWIHGFENGVYTSISNADWVLLTSGAMCYYNNLEENVSVLTPKVVKSIQLSTGFYPLGIKEYGGVLYIISGKLPDTLAENVDEYVEGTSYTVGKVIYNSTSKLFFECKVTGTYSLPIEGSNTYWELIGTEADYNNTYGMVEIGSYPSPEASDKRLYDGTETIYNNTATMTTYRWYPTGVTSCVLDETGRKTGYQLVEEKYQTTTDGGSTWEDVISEPYRTSTYFNSGACPVPFKWAGISVDSTEYNTLTEVSITYVENTQILVNTPIKVGYNYVFLSIPQTKTIIVRDSSNNDITDKFIEVDIDDRPEHTINKIYRKTDMFATDLSTVIYLTIL